MAAKNPSLLVLVFVGNFPSIHDLSSSLCTVHAVTMTMNLIPCYGVGTAARNCSVSLFTFFGESISFGFWN